MLMSQLGHQLPLRANAERGRYAPISGLWLNLIDWPKGAITGREQMQQKQLSLFDHLVGNREQRWRNGEAER